MHGTLVGTWFTTSFIPTYDSPTLFAAKGTERFVGCVDSNRNRTCNASEPQGTLRFAFIYWANFDAATGAFKHAQCVHPVTRGTGSFAGATGLLLMDDHVHGGEVKTNYHGEIQFAGGGSASQSVPASAQAPRAAAGRAPGLLSRSAQGPPLRRPLCGPRLRMSRIPRSGDDVRAGPSVASAPPPSAWSSRGLGAPRLAAPDRLRNAALDVRHLSISPRGRRDAAPFGRCLAPGHR
jgi:hypothetical protein